MTNKFETLVSAVESARGDYEKAHTGNKAASARVRKAMQDVKNLAQDIRKEMLEIREPAPAPAKPGVGAVKPK